MELPQSYVQYRRGPCASAPKDTVAIKGGGTTPRKFDLTKERCREVENRERTALARSFSFEAQGLNGAQVISMKLFAEGHRRCFRWRNICSFKVAWFVHRIDVLGLESRYSGSKAARSFLLPLI